MNETKVKPWPADGLEHLGRCPVCGSSARTLLHEKLEDKVFFCAPGTWSMWRCDDCRSGYLDPRPTVDAIGQAYTAYYTHEAKPDIDGLAGPKRKHRIVSLRKRIRPAYRNAFYGYAFKPDLGWLNFLTLWLPGRATLNFHYPIRHLPSPKPGEQLLDIGCGNGSFLETASGLGFAATGIEIDSLAVQAARSKGLDVVEGSLPHTGLESERFAHVTLNHVVEHLHDPLAGLREVHRLLKRGGRVWMQFPNIDALGHEIYGPAWRGLEPPRHLVMPSFEGIKRMLVSAQFTDVRLMEPADAVEGYFDRSDEIKRHLNLPEGLAAPVSSARRRKALRYERRHPERHEQLTLAAYKT